MKIGMYVFTVSTTATLPYFCYMAFFCVKWKRKTYTLTPGAQAFIVVATRRSICCPCTGDLLVVERKRRDINTSRVTYM